MLRQVISALLTSLLVLSCVQAQDKQGPPQNKPGRERFEVGVQFSMLRQGDGVFIFGPTSAEVGDLRLDRTAMGGGGRAVYNFNRFLSLEAEVNVFPEQNVFLQHAHFVCCGVGTVIDGRMVEGVAGTKIGIRGRKLGIFGRIRPGFLHSAKTLGDCTRVIVGLQCDFDRGRTDFVLDVGGTVEASVSRRLFLRFDLGDLIQFFPGLENRNLPFPPADTRARRYHNFQFSTGTGFRF